MRLLVGFSYSVVAADCAFSNTHLLLLSLAVAEKSITASTMTFLGLQKAQGLSGSSWSCQQIGHLDSGSLKKEEFFKRSQTAYV